MYTPEIETKPIPDQLFRLASIGVCLAKEQGKLKESRQADNAHIFLAQDNEVIEVHDEEEYSRSTHKFIGRIARVGYKRWSMRIAEPYWVSAEDGEDGYRATYAFEWTDKETIFASKRMNAKAPEENFMVDLKPEEVDAAMLQPDFLHAVSEFETMSSADCVDLIKAMHEFSTGPRYSVIEYNK